MKFVDELEIKVVSGHGGTGWVSFRREAMVARGGPDGGDGGKGGDIIFQTSPNSNTLIDFRDRKTYSAENGHPGAKQNRSGADGQPLVLKVPRGTLIKLKESQQVIADLTDHQEIVLLKGGRGGKGNTFFKNSVNQAPENAQPGEEGQELELILELKLIADVGIIGFPNAGKSTLISRISAAKPKIADYPFTTLTPQLGVVRMDDETSFVVADIPGLIPGAHLGVGLGIQFLKHIERTRVFVHLIDVSGMSGQDPWDSYQEINHELKMYDETYQGKEGFHPLSSRQQIVVFNKIETLSSEDLEKVQNKFAQKTEIQPMSISAVTGKNLKELLFVLKNKLSAEANQKA